MTRVNTAASPANSWQGTGGYAQTPPNRFTPPNMNDFGRGYNNQGGGLFDRKWKLPLFGMGCLGVLLLVIFFAKGILFRHWIISLSVYIPFYGRSLWSCQRALRAHKLYSPTVPVYPQRLKYI